MSRISLLFFVFYFSCASHNNVMKKAQHVEAKSSEEIQQLIFEEMNSPRVPEEHRQEYLALVNKNLKAIEELNNEKNKLLTYLVLNGRNENFPLKDARKIVKEVKKIELKIIDYKMENLSGLKILVEDRLEEERIENILNYFHARF